MKIFSIPLNAIAPSVASETSLAMRLTIDLFRVLTRDENMLPLLTPVSIIDYINMHQKRTACVLRGSAWSSSYFPLSLAQALFIFNFSDFQASGTNSDMISQAKRKSYELGDFIKSFYFEIAKALHEYAADPKFSSSKILFKGADGIFTLDQKYIKCYS